MVAIVPFFAGPSDAFNLGALQKSSSVNVSAGETAVFRILFWNVEPEKYQMAISTIDAPAGWAVIASPEEFMLNSTPIEKTERIYLSNTKSTVSAKAVDIFVTIPENEAAGKYAVVLHAIAGSGTSGGFSMIQERQFSFNLNVVKGKQKIAALDIQNNITSNIPDSPEPKQIAAAGNESDAESTEFFSMAAYVFGIFAIILIAWGIYKYE